MIGVATAEFTLPGTDLVMVGVLEASVLTSVALLRSDSFVLFLAGVPDRDVGKGRSGTAGVIACGVAACGVGMPGGGRMDALDGVPVLLTGAERPGGTVGVERRGCSRRYERSAMCIGCMSASPTRASTLLERGSCSPTAIVISTAWPSG